MYLSKDIIRSLLQVNGYEDIFVSSDVGFTKNSGNMYTYIIKKMDEDPQNYLHIRDNYYSDGNACWKCGMNYMWTVKRGIILYSKIKRDFKRIG